MVTTKQMNIKNRTYYFYNDLINIKDFDPKLLKLDKKSFKNITIYYIGYITKKDGYKTNKVNIFYLLVDEIDDFIQEKEGSKYLKIASTDSTSEVLKKYEEVSSGVKEEYGKDNMKIQFNSNDDLPLNKILKFRILTIIIRAVFEKDDNYYPEIF